MLFNSIDYLIFLPIVLVIYFILPKKIKHIWLLVASYYFYMCWNAVYALLILTSTLITYLSGLCLEAVKQSQCTDDKKIVRKKIVVAVSFIANLSILFFFKYYNFTFDLLRDIFAVVKINLTVPYLDVILPVGISFYTFQALSYTMDVYRDEIYAEKDFFRYALFVSFFPQLVAGPIERSKNLLKQLAVPKEFDFDNIREGLLIMLWGFFLKMVLADRAAIFVNEVYLNYTQYPGFYLIVATLLFAVQVYCDFAGYSTIAMGSAKMLGISLMENFDAPFFSATISEFWRRWHISLTSWFKDYLYIPLGGSRKGYFRKQVNKMIVFIVSGLWHGASLTYVAWGGINGLYQVIGEVLQPVRDKAVAILHLNRQSLGHRMAKVLCTFVLFDFSLVFFRADTIKAAIEIFKSVFTVYNPWILFDGALYECGLDDKNFRLLLLAVAVMLFVDFCKHRGIVIRNVILRQDYWFRYVFIAVSILLILLFGKYGPTYDSANFIYFQF